MWAPLSYGSGGGAVSWAPILPHGYRFCRYPQNLCGFLHPPATCLHIAVISNFIFIGQPQRCEVMGARDQAVVVGTYPRNPQERGAGTRDLCSGTTRGCFDEFQTER